MQRGEMAFGRYLQVRVLINISKSLKRGSKITVICGENILAIFKYENYLISATYTVSWIIKSLNVMR